MERKQEQDTTDDRQKQGNPADETVIYKIGGTFYEVSTSCGGSDAVSILLVIIVLCIF